MKTQSTQASSAQQNLNNTKIPVNVAFSENDLVYILQQRGYTVTAADEKAPLPEQPEESATFTERRAPDSPMRAKPEPIPAKPNFGVCTISNAMNALWNHAADSLSPKQLKWMTDLSDLAEQESKNLADSLATIAVTLNGVNKTSEPSSEQTATLLFSVAHQLDVIAAMVNVSGGAAYRLANPELYDRKPENIENAFDKEGGV